MHEMEMIKVDKATLKATLKELLLEDSNILKEVIKEVLAEQVSKARIERLEKLNKIIDEDFEEYDEIFRALAKR